MSADVRATLSPDVRGNRDGGLLLSYAVLVRGALIRGAFVCDFLVRGTRRRRSPGTEAARRSLFAGASGIKCRLHRRPPVRDEQQVVAAPAAGRLGTPGDRVQDGLAILAPRILVGDHDEAATLAGDPAHLGTFGRVALAGRTKEDDEAGAPRRRRGRQQVQHRLE